MSRRPLRIGLFGLFGVRNIGNEATLAATVAALRERAPDAELSAAVQDLDPLALAREAIGDLSRSVRRGVVDDQDVRGIVDREDGTHEGLEVVRFVVGRRDHENAGRHRARMLAAIDAGALAKIGI